MLTNIITAVLILIIYTCLVKGKIFTEINKLLNLFVFGSITILMISSIVTITNLSLGNIQKVQTTDYIPIVCDSTNQYYTMKPDNEIVIYNKLSDTTKSCIIYQPSDCIIDTTSNINYVTRIQSEYLPNKWVSSLMLPNIKTIRILHMTRKEYSNLLNVNKDITSTWTIQKSL